MGMASPIYYTAYMVRTLPDDGRRYEVVRGELLVTPAPRAWHQVLHSRLHSALSTYLAQEPIGIVLSSPADISWAEDVLVQPDLFVVPQAEVRTLDWAQMRHLLLAVEVLSPSTTRADRFTKRAEYQRQGVPVYWIVDGEAKTVEVWTPDDRFPAQATDRLSWHPQGAREAMRIALPELFRPV